MNPFIQYIEALQGAHIEEQFFKFKDAFSTKMTDIINKVFNNPQLDSLLGQ